jgi:hypothetical protein
MNGIFKFYASMVNISYDFLYFIKIIHMGLEFYNAMMRIFIFLFAIHILKSKYAKVE